MKTLIFIGATILVIATSAFAIANNNSKKSTICPDRPGCICSKTVAECPNTDDCVCKK